MSASHIVSIHIAMGRWLLRLSLLGVASFALGALIAAAAWANTDGLKRLGEAESGALMLKSTTPGLYVEAPRVATDVKMTVTGPLARTKITQRFTNASDAWAEGIYVFPLPDGAAVDTLKMQIGERLIEGEIEERQKAKALYEAAKREGKKASLLEQQRANMFTNAVANIGPGETIVIQIEYQEAVRLENGAFSLRVPLVVAPRYNPLPVQRQLVELDEATGWGTVDPVPDRDAIAPPVLHPDAGPINPVTLTVDLDAGFPISTVTSSYHAVTSKEVSDRKRIIQLAEDSVPADKDFELVWRPQDGASPSAALFKEMVDDETYYLLMITPQADETKPKQIARDITFVIDTSGSMQGTSIRQARESLAMAVGRLAPQDRFNIIQFNSSMSQMFAAPMPASQINLDIATGYIKGLVANGGTEMLPALSAALHHQSGSDRLTQVVFLTDGAIGNEQQLFETITQQRGEARLFTVGIGSAPNSFFMSRAAELGRGSFTHIGDLTQVRERMGALLTKLETPAMTNIATDWPDGTAAEAWPAPVPDLYFGETTVIAAKADAQTGEVALSGQDGQRDWRADLSLDQAASRPGIGKLWARKKIASLELLRAYPNAKPGAIDAGILDVALTHGLVSRLTSLVAIDKTPSRPEENTLVSSEMPTNLPSGWDFEAVFGDVDAGFARPAAAPAKTAPMMRKVMNLKSTRLASASAQPGPGIALQATATLWEVRVSAGLILVLLGVMGIMMLRRAD
ncbi:MAG: marine proteobacterial sortase target protein [Pseudomonadota bacterium]